MFQLLQLQQCVFPISQQSAKLHVTFPRGDHQTLFNTLVHEEHAASKILDIFFQSKEHMF